MKFNFLSHTLWCWKTYFCNLLTFITWWVCIVEKKISYLNASKQLTIVFKNRNQNFAFAFENVWLGLEFPNLLFHLKYYPTTLERQLNYLKWFATMSIWPFSNLSTMLCHQSFLVQCLLYWNLLEASCLFREYLKAYSIQKLRQECLSLFLLL